MGQNGLVNESPKQGNGIYTAQGMTIAFFTRLVKVSGSYDPKLHKGIPRQLHILGNLVSGIQKVFDQTSTFKQIVA